jgi:hydrogenase expression/formation protein HypE
MLRYPLGKLSHEQLAGLLKRLPPGRSRDVIVGPAIGEDAAAIAVGRQALVVATDPVTFAADRAGWYAVHVNANDVATMGAAPRWFQACVLMPPTSRVGVESIFDDIAAGCREVGAVVLGGHTEVTAGLPHPIVIGTMMGLVDRKAMVRTAGAAVGDAIVLTGSAAIEATSIIARHRQAALARTLGRRLVERAARFLFDPGISIVREALIAGRSGATAMHDPTEGGILTGLWEMAQAGRRRFVVDADAIPVRSETRRVCDAYGIDPLRAIASGSLLMTTPARRATNLLARLRRAGIAGTIIGRVCRGRAGLFDRDGVAIPISAKDEITRLFEQPEEVGAV